MQPLDNPPPLFFDQRGALLDAGSVYIGTVNEDPESAPVTVYWDSALTISATQPLRTRGGVIVNNGAPALVFISGSDYSMRVRDSGGNQVAYFPSVTATASTSYQPLSAALTALAALALTTYGEGLLTLADAPSARTYLGIVASLPLTGGTVSGNIVRSGGGPHAYHTDSALTSGRIFHTTAGAADPTSTDGDIWLETAP
jgi:hypothetical protein